MRILTIIVTILLSACTQFIEHNTVIPFPDSGVRYISVHKLSGGDPKVEAYVELTGNECKVFLRKYPRCLQHEIRHCYEGNWHEGRKSAEEC